MTDVKRVMVALAQLAEVEMALETLIRHNIVKQESKIKGMRKFVHEHPEIQVHLREQFKESLRRVEDEQN